MNTPPDSYRRKFIKAFTAALLFLPYSKYLGANTDTSSVSINTLENFFTNKRDAFHEIGAAYLEASPDEADKEKLFTSIFPKNTYADLSSGDNWHENIRAYIEKKSYFDFLSGNITTVRGWKLSTTEVHLCALSYLLSHS